MKKVLLWLMLSIGCLVAGNSPTIIMNSADITVTDGDTVKVSFDISGCPNVLCEKLEIRISGIDTPEIHGKTIKEQQLAKLAKTQMSVWLSKDEKVNFHDCKRDKYFRLNCGLSSEKGGEYSDFIIANRLAIPYHGELKTYDWSLHSIK
jgi:endonuclease YncB( thermonuclease family)